MKKLLLFSALMLAMMVSAQNYGGKNKDKPSFYSMGIANYDLRGSDKVGVSAAINYYCVYAEANTNVLFNNNRTDITNFNMGYSFFFLDNNLALIPTVGISHIDRYGDKDNRFNSGFILQTKIHKPLYIYTGVGKYDGVKLGLSLKL